MSFSLSSSNPSESFQKSSHVALYSKYRPTYPDSLVKLILDYLNKNGGAQDLVVDVGCGSGQFTIQLQEHFKQCVGIDISSAQIKEAQEKASAKKNMRFLVGDASELPVESGTVDLVTAATSWHWFPDKDRFFTECKRVLKSSGCVAVLAYSVPYPSSVKKLVQSFMLDTLKDYTDEAVQLIYNEYEGVVLPFNDVERYDLVMPSSMSVADFIGFISSSSCYQNFLEAHPGNSALKELEQAIMTELTGAGSTSSPQEVQLDLEFPLFALVGKK